MKKRRLTWSEHAGGTSAAEGRNGYTAHTEAGEYHVDPYTTARGSHAGYLCRFANTKGLSGVSGLWHGVQPNGILVGIHAEPRYRSAAQARKAAALHYDGVGVAVALGKASTQEGRTAEASSKEPFRYKGYNVSSDMAGTLWYIAKDGFVIGTAKSRDEARKTIDTVVGP